jgi:hypothetical protein
MGNKFVSRRKSMRASVRILATAFFVMVLVWCSFGMNHSSSQAYNVPRQVLDGGGAMWDSTVGYKLCSSIGQSITGVHQGGTKTVYVGFWNPWVVEASPVEWEEEDLSLRPTEFDLRQNYPNPFNPATTIQYALPRASEVSVEVYNILGQRVRSLVDEQQDPGYKTLWWDGKDDYGNEVSSGVYFYRIEAGDFVQSKKMTLLK